jgi:hypothetical protein
MALLSKDNVDNLMKIFAKLDRSRDGKLDSADFDAWKVRRARRAEDARCVPIGVGHAEVRRLHGVARRP